MNKGQGHQINDLSVIIRLKLTSSFDEIEFLYYGEKKKQKKKTYGFDIKGL